MQLSAGLADLQLIALATLASNLGRQPCLTGQPPGQAQSQLQKVTKVVTNNVFDAGRKLNQIISYLHSLQVSFAWPLINSVKHFLI